MYLSRLYIKNFRSVRNLDLSFSKGKNVIVGRNNAGKSNLIKALDLVLGESSPTYSKSENVTENDFYSWKENEDGRQVVRSADELFIWCELQREDGELLNYEDINSCFGYYVHTEIVEWEKIGTKSYPIKEPIRIPRDSLPDNYGAIFEITEDISKDKTWVDAKLKNHQTFKKQLDDKYTFAYAFHACKDEEGKVTKDIRFLYCENEIEDWILCFKANVRTELLQSAIIPSFRDPQSQLRLSGWTWYGKLMKHLTENHERLSELKEALDRVKGVADEIFATVNVAVTESSLNVAFPGTSLHFQFNADQRTDLYKNCVIYVDDGFKSQLSEKGSGIQSSTIIGLFNYYTRYVNTSTSALLCIEEPEIYLHPHARRVISDRLDVFLDENRNQVILTTHSVEFIRTTSTDLNIILVQKDEEGTRATPVQIRDFKHLLVNNNQNELFFADKVIVCEGYDDYILRAVAKELYPQKLDEQNVSVISVGGKDNISELVRLILKLGIKCYLFTDFDYLLRDKGDERKKYGAKAHESIINVGECFFTQACIFGSHGTVVYSKLRELRNKLKSSDEEAFYTGKTSDCFSIENLKNRLDFLRKNGVCILYGEVENLSRDPTFIYPGDKKKLSLDKVYELTSRIESGQNASDLLETRQITELLEVVFAR